ncbi:signal recognition particle subunit SRP68 [Plasmodium brasilianum]|uniref:Signal recognition particle subunit SRP68 n=2 Tax=Plasmodium (Plasmodium) TaxID=418103 RepID=A0A1A8W577_PLAMA|nr:signal recognition particle subunit SRP68, putative [Plasmodium malariae]KAI4837284.1 signal recognition particle subunit SRP68 [Plasmodium brasilianum]SBS87153.1 signal recognition particle subunit SRP68, putative [Plasmodium malariae]SCO93166.1 signal recognition particle subunit SRP68, putative [Plasmodium malariae]
MESVENVSNDKIKENGEVMPHGGVSLNEVIESVCTVTPSEDGKREGKVRSKEKMMKRLTKDKVCFDIFSYLRHIYKKYGLYDEEIERFLLFVKKRRAKLKKKVLCKVKKIENKYLTKVYETDIEDEKYFELLLLDVEACRCRYIQIKTHVNELKIPYRSKYRYIRRIRRALDKVKFLGTLVNKNSVDANTELQVKCYQTYIEISYLLEMKKYEECILKVEEFTKLIKLIKRITLNMFTNINKERNEEVGITDGIGNIGGGGGVNQISTNENSKSKVVERSIKHTFDGMEKNELMIKSNVLIEEEKRIEQIFDYFISTVNSYERICTYNLKKNKSSNFNEKRQDENLAEEVNNITEIKMSEDTTTCGSKLEIHCIDNVITIKLKCSIFEIKDCEHNSSSNRSSNNSGSSIASVLRIKNILEGLKSVVQDEEFTTLNVDVNIKDITRDDNFPLFKFLKELDINFTINEYRSIFGKYFECLSVVHEQLIKSTNENNKLSNDDRLMEKIWTELENYLLSQKLYIDTERILLVLMKNFYHVYTKSGSKNISFVNKKTLKDIVDEMPELHTNIIRYADILKQNIEELKNLENNDSFINIFQIIKNVKSLCLACYYAMNNKNAEAHVLFDLIKTRNYIYIKLNSMQIYNNSLFRVSVLFNNLQNLVSIINEIYYFRHLAIYALQVKTKSLANEHNLFYLDNSFFQRKMSYISLNPLHIDMTQMCCEDSLLNPDLQKEEKSSGIRGLLWSFWK